MGIGLMISLFFVDALAISSTAMFSSASKSDFRFSDFFAKIADHRNVRKLDDRIIVVDIGEAGRREIAEGIETLSLCGPKAIGIDINFESSDSYDNIILEALASNQNVVVPLGLSSNVVTGEFEVSDKPFFYGEDLPLSYGVINLPTNVENGVVREYPIEFKTDQGLFPSFMAAILRKADTKAAEKLRERGASTGITLYESREYQIIRLYELEDYAETFADRIVLLGSIDDESDLHSTPLKVKEAGILLHAAAISTALDGIWFQQVPKTVAYILACILGFSLTLFSYSFKSNLKGLMLRLLQGLLAFLCVRIGYELYVEHYVIFDISLIVMIIAFGFLGADVWNGIETLWKMASIKIKNLSHKNRLTTFYQNLDTGI